ncbi:hypothetical protein K450DRAFT_248058 [Umbelopsis ramanniana AG]|uniref:Xylulose kinase n=1 Tax=Umbelopsis ramanniana AG TaxID=1314678 RepID=A0AAD5E9T0_UMBRA|nr:uncharacterized protein K450DRAFT_248058 [Umbelopsis ramanniana AG]KAI8578275.1 hypothetical protein K450DRAFT_248058 [Umbelopsis ramanniana AG]
MAQNQSDLYLGLDLSTQQLKYTVINHDHDIIAEAAVHFDRDLPEFHTTNGAIAEGDVVTSPTLMWVKAIDILLERLSKNTDIKIENIKGISGAGQQHGSVYWNKEGLETLASLDVSRTLEDQLQGAFSVKQSPIWQDASTTSQCRSLENLVGGPQGLADLTGSKGYERFTGNQIAKLYEQNPSAYDATARISLVSSFIASVLLGQLAPVDVADGSGMNMMDIHTHKWIPSILEHCGGKDLQKKLESEPVEGGTNLGAINSYFVTRYGFSSECTIAPFTGDNPATLVSMNLEQGDCVVSLGTSDTMLMYLPEANPTTESHLMSHPTNPEAYMGMLCYKNGSLTREKIRDEYAEGDWTTFNNLLHQAPPGLSNGCNRRGYYYYMQEIIPFAKGFHRFENDIAVDEFTGTKEEVASYNVRAIVESQFLSMKVRTSRMLDTHGKSSDASHLKRILATGGAASNPNLLQVLSNVFNIPVYKKQGMNSASLGGALLAKFAVRRLHGYSGTFEQMMEDEQRDKVAHQLVAEPQAEYTEVYNDLVEGFVRLEQVVIANTQ